MKKFLIISTIIFIFLDSHISKFISDKLRSTDSYFTKVIDKDIYVTKNDKWENAENYTLSLQRKRYNF